MDSAGGRGQPEKRAGSATTMTTTLCLPVPPAKGKKITPAGIFPRFWRGGTRPFRQTGMVRVSAVRRRLKITNYVFLSPLLGLRNDSIVDLSPQGSPLMSPPQKLPYPRLLRITCATIGVLLTLPWSDTASAQATLTWSGGGGNPNAVNLGNWVDAPAPISSNDYHFFLSSSYLVSIFRTSRT
jgi:hypothetical protein